MRVLTYNTYMYYPGYGDLVRADKFRQHLIAGEWDIVALNEVYNKSLRKVLLEDKNLVEKYPYCIYGTDTFGSNKYYTFDNGLVLLSKFPIIRHQRHEFNNSLNKWYNRPLPKKELLFAEIEKDGVNIGVFTTHLQWGRSAIQTKYRYLQMQELREYIEKVWSFDKPLLLIGDLNIFDKVEDPDYQTFIRIFPELTDWFLSHNDLSKNPGYTWHRINSKVLLLMSEHRFDYICSNHFFTSKSSNIVKFRGKVHLQKIQWQSINPFTKNESLWFTVAWLSRILFSPIIFAYYIFINIIRVLYGSNLIIFFMDRDLSDHYGLEGSCDFNHR